MELRDAIHRIALEWPSYGRPRITAELRRQGWTVNHKRVRRLADRWGSLSFQRTFSSAVRRVDHNWI